MFKVVQSIEVFSATVENLNGDGNSVHSREYLGDFETKRAAEQVLADYGFTHKDRNGYREWVQNYQRAYVQRRLIERSTPTRDDIIMCISDLSKEVYGFRVRRNYGVMSDAELEQEYNHFLQLAELLSPQPSLLYERGNPQ